MSNITGNDQDLLFEGNEKDNPEINVDSLWIIDRRESNGKHDNTYHGNFIPYIPNQFIRRYTMPGGLVIDPFMGNGTTLFECEKLGRKFIGTDINERAISNVKEKMKDSEYDDYYISTCDSTDKRELLAELNQGNTKLKTSKAQLVVLHPPYLDIVKFTEHDNDLSRISDVEEFLRRFSEVVDNILEFTDKGSHIVLIMGDLYRDCEIIPLGFLCMESIRRKYGLHLRGIIVKNIEGNRGKRGMESLWKYRAQRHGYFIFKHEYIFVFRRSM